jgi:hypothetical protein
MRIRLPDFYDSIRHWFAVAVENAARNFHTLARYAWPRQIVAIEPAEADLKKWPYRLRCSRMQAHGFSP